jgi:hypothetical protein
MRVSKILSAVAAVGVALVGVATTTDSRAGDEELVSVTCNAGAVTATGQQGYHTNPQAPWKWDKGEKVSVDEHAAKFKGAKCEGTIKAYVCKADQCKGPLSIAVK